MIKISHNSGFFSCCSVRLSKIVEFINLNKRLPDIVDSSQQFRLYKNDKNKDKDITFHYFENYNNIKDINIISYINYNHSYQFKKYSDLDYEFIIPLIKKYFSPSIEVNNNVNKIQKNMI